MIVAKSRDKLGEHFKELLMLNIRGVLENTNFKAFVDNEELPQNIYIEDDYFTFMYAEDQTFIHAFDEQVKDDYFAFSGTNEAVLQYYLQHGLIHWKNTCSQYHYDGDKFDDVMALDSLTIEDAKFVDDNYEYKNENSLKKIERAISKRPSSCMRVDGEIVSFVLLHDDDSIGYMYTVPEYRGKGYAYELTKDIVNKTIDSGRIPYVQIVKGNYKSEKLAEKSGFVYHGDVHWFGVVRIGDEFKAILERYQEEFSCRPVSVSTKTTISLHPTAELDVKLVEQGFEYNGVVYPYRMITVDENVLFHSEMPEDILLAGLMQLLEHDYDIVFVNNTIKHQAFRTI